MFVTYHLLARSSNGMKTRARNRREKRRMGGDKDDNGDEREDGRAVLDDECDAWLRKLPTAIDRLGLAPNIMNPN